MRSLGHAIDPPGGLVASAGRGRWSIGQVVAVCLGEVDDLGQRYEVAVGVVDAHRVRRADERRADRDGRLTALRAGAGVDFGAPVGEAQDIGKWHRHRLLATRRAYRCLCGGRRPDLGIDLAGRKDTLTSPCRSPPSSGVGLRTTRPPSCPRLNPVAADDRPVASALGEREPGSAA